MVSAMMAIQSHVQEDEVTALMSIFDGTSCFRLIEPLNDCLVSGELQAYPKILDELIIIEGQRSHTVKFLPPIALRFQLPPSYPQETPPQYTISCKWLTRTQLSKLCRKLDGLWKETMEPILYSWIDFLQQDALNFLGTHSQVVLLPDDHESCELDDRATQEFASQNLLFDVLVDYDNQQRLKEFNRSVMSCQVCLSEKEGLQCMRFHECSHVFCRDCMSNFFTVRIEEGAVNNLVCPVEKCPTLAHPLQVKDLVATALFEKYERLVLQSTLESMTDVVYCPRPSCQSPVLLEKEGNMGICPSCYYVFCALCKCFFHGIAPCRNKYQHLIDVKAKLMTATEAERQLLAGQYGEELINQLWSSMQLTKSEPVDHDELRAVLLTSTEEERKSLSASYGEEFINDLYVEVKSTGCASATAVTEVKAKMLVATAKERTALAASYGKQLVQHLWGEMSSASWISDNCKECPRCSTAIQKSDGCNKMTCTKCQCYFCWVCLTVLSSSDPYTHFDRPSKCDLFINIA